MPNFISLPPFAEDRDVQVVVETPRESRAKFAYDPKLETFILSNATDELEAKKLEIIDTWQLRARG